MAYETYEHRDGLTLQNVRHVETELSIKRDRRPGWTITRSIILAETDQQAAEFSRRMLGGPSAGWYGVVAFANDIHHAVMTPEQLDKLSEDAAALARKVREMRAIMAEFEAERVAEAAQ